MCVCVCVCVCVCMCVCVWTWHDLYDFDHMPRDQVQKILISASEAQFSLLNVLSENFGTHEKLIFADHDPAPLSWRKNTSERILSTGMLTSSFSHLSKARLPPSG